MAVKHFGQLKREEVKEWVLKHSILARTNLIGGCTIWLRGKRGGVGHRT